MKRLVVLILFISAFGIAQETDCACCTKKHSQFDFWIGTWEVTNPDGSYAGTNVIEKIEDNCVLREQWTSATPGLTGTSHNFINRSTQKWEQVWVDNKGGSIHLKGGLSDGVMVLESEAVSNNKGRMVVNRVTWTPNEDGTVRQFWETSIDNEKTWTVAFDGLYRRK